MTAIKQYSDLRDLVYFVVKNYPYPKELSKARLTKIIFLMDWKASLDYGMQITGINWYFDSYGPYVLDVVRTAERNTDLFSIVESITPYFSYSKIIEINNENYYPTIPKEVVYVYDFIVEKTEMLNFSEFINFVYSTYPIQTGSRYTYLDLPTLAQAYKNN